MQPFLGFSPAAPLGASSASDAPTSDTRSASDPANADAFRSALSAAHQRSNGSENTRRSNGRTNEAPRTDDDTTTSESDSTTESAISADALAMLLTWLAPVPTPQTPTGSGDTPLAMDPIGTTALGASAEDIATAASATSAFAVSQLDPTLAGAIPPSTDGITLPAGMTTTPDGAPDLMPRTAPAPAATMAASEALDQDLLATLQATTEARAAGASAAGSTTPAGGEATSAQAAASASSTAWADLAADFGAQIVATTTPAATRSAGPGASATGQAPLVDEGQVPTPGSTAQAAGAGTTAGVQLPGQAVAAPGASSQATTGTFAEALEAGPEGVSAARASQGGAEAPTELHAAIGSAGTTGTSQTADVDTVQASATTAPPIATQIADGALMAARRIGQSVEMILQPEGLGAVSLRVSVERGGLGVHIAVENPQAREMVQASWPQLQQALEQRGLTVQSLMLDLSNGRGNNEAFQQFNGQQQFTGQQARGGSANGDQRGNAAVNAVDESARTQPGAATASRVDYRI